jgi:hypothetical protein
MRRFIAALILLTLFLPVDIAVVAEPPGIEVFTGYTVAEPQPVQVAQQRRRRTLLDLLFGNDEEEPPPSRRQQQQQQQTDQAPVADLPPAKPAVEKAPGATRLAVFGDSLAVDLAKALERLYAEDPNLLVIDMGVGSSSFVRPDYFDWDATIADEIANNTFDIAVIIIGINDRQTINLADQSFKALTPEWTQVYTDRANSFAAQLRAAGKPTIWIGLPPMSKPEYSAALTQISAIHRMTAFSNGAEFLDIYERFVDENGQYSSFGPDINGQNVRIRKDDGIHFAAAGADKLAFYLSQSIKLFYRGGGGIGFEIADPLAGTDAQLMQRPPFQGLGQIRMLEVAGAVIPLSTAPKRAPELLSVDTAATVPAAFDIEEMVLAPVGRVDSFGAGVTPEEPNNSGR